MNTHKKQNFNRWKYLIITITYLSIMYFLIPSKTVIQDEFIVHQELFNDFTKETVYLDLEYREYKSIISDVRYKGVLTYKGSKYRFEQGGSERNKTWIRIRSPFVYIGDVLHTSDLSEFVFILRDGSRFNNGESNLKFVVYPERSNEEANQLLYKLIANYNYNTNWLTDSNGGLTK